MPQASTPVGGGEGYPHTVTRAEATVVASTLGGIDDALTAADAGDVVWVPNNASITVRGEQLHIPPGVTLASTRGINGTAGALFDVTIDQNEFIMLGEGARLTGFWIQGPHLGWSASRNSDANAIKSRVDNTEVDNCEIRGFNYAGIITESGGDCHVHNNVITEITRGGYGYGVSIQGDADALIEYNYFDQNRHSVAGNGRNHGYICRFNHFGPNMSDTHIDQHGTDGGTGGSAATRVVIANNVVEGYIVNGPGGPGDEGDVWQNVQIRGVPRDIAHIENNWFWNPNPPAPGTWANHAVIQPPVSDWDNVTFSNNHYGKDAGVRFTDIIPGYTGWRSDASRGEPSEPPNGGNGNGGGNGGPPPEMNTLRFESTDDTPAAWFQVTSADEIRAGAALEPGTDQRERVFRRNDGVWVGEGQFGPTGADSLELAGQPMTIGVWRLLNFPENPRYSDEVVPEQLYRLVWNGEAVQIADIAEQTGDGVDLQRTLTAVGLAAGAYVLFT